MTILIQFPSAYFEVIKMIILDILNQPMQYIVPRTLQTVQIANPLSVVMC